MVLIHKLGDYVHAMQDEGDSLFVGCAGCEPRSTAIVQKLKLDYKTRNAAIFRCLEYRDKGDTPTHFTRLQTKLREVCDSLPSVIDFGFEHPIPAFQKFESLYREWDVQRSISTVTVDITSFPRQELLMLLRVLESLPNPPKIRLVYTEPERYATEEPGGWLTRGVRTVKTVPGFGGIQPPGKKKLLILFLGHEGERAEITWKRHQPERTIAIIPSPSARNSLNGIIENTHEGFLSRLADIGTERVTIPAMGIEETKTAIFRLWKRYNTSYFLVIAPYGTKLQTLGIYLAIRQKRDLQITYALPSVYNFRYYSGGIGSTWEILWN